MMWDHVMERVVAEILMDDVLATIYGDAVRAAGTGEQIVPSLEWTLVGDTENELWAPMIVQFDQWTKTGEQNRRSEFRLRQLYHRDVPRTIAGDTMMWTMYSDGAVLAMPDRSNFIGRTIRFTFTPLRAKYAGRLSF